MKITNKIITYTYDWPIRTIWYLLHKYHPNYQFHIIKLKKLKPGYHDPFIRITHAVFDIACEFEETYRDIYINKPPEWKTLVEICNWWRQNQGKDCDILEFTEIKIQLHKLVNILHIMWT